MKISDYEFPIERADFDIRKIINSNDNSYEYKKYYFEKNTSIEATLIATQYFSIEDHLLESFLYVTPINNNKNTCSARFASIIRESCNLYEVLCKKIYSQIFEVKKNKKLNIFDYLILERYFKLANEEIGSAILYNYLNDGKRIMPFYCLSKWDAISKPKIEHIPEWWNSYNKIKHSTENIVDAATLDSAIYATSAVFQIIKMIYGKGLIYGYLYEPQEDFTDKLYPVRTSNIFQGDYLRTTLRR